MNATATPTTNAAPANTGVKTKPHPGGPSGLSRISSGSEAAGGWLVWVSRIAMMASPTPTPIAHQALPNSVSTAMPTNADTTCPPMTLRGWATGLSGTTNIKKHDAPSGAISSG